MTRHKEIGARPISLGRNDSRGSILLGDGEVADLFNIDLDRESWAASRGSIKFGNQVAPSTALETRVDKGFGRLPVLPGKSVPLRGYAYIPYDERQDIGGIKARADFDAGTVNAGATLGFFPTYNAQRGQNFEIAFSFRVPEEQKLYNPTDAKLYDPDAGFESRLGADIALDEFTAIVQKGGDRLQPMSWAIGIVNAGRLFDIAINTNGTNIFGVLPSVHADRTSGYCLCFMWLDAPRFGEQFPVQMRYRLTNGQIRADDAPNLGGGHEESQFGAYSTHAYRAFVIPKFVEPGRNYNFALQLQLDSGTPGTGAEPTVSWSNNGVIRAVVMDGSISGRGSEVFEYDQTVPNAARIYRYKGPADSLEYFTKYGIRYHGRDPMYVGLGMRYASWASGGFMPFGIDSAPLEKGGFRIIDQSIHFPTAYTESSTPDSTSGVGGPSYFLRVARTAAGDATGRLIEVSDKGMVYNLAGYPAVTWGAVNAAWAGVAPTGRSPLGGRFSALSDPAGTTAGVPFDEHWRGLAGDRSGILTASQGRGFNPEALRGYRLILAPDSPSTGFSNVGAAGGIFSIQQYENVPVIPLYTQRIQTEGDLSPWIGGNPDFQGNAFRAYVRAFRWNQRPVVVSDLRIYSGPRNYSNPLTSLSLMRFPDLRDSTDPGIATLVGGWRLDEADTGELVDIVSGNSGYRAPYTMPKSSGGSRGSDELFISGDGEALRLDFGSNPFLRELISDMQLQGRSGFAIEITCRIPEAAYGIPRKKTIGAGPSTDVWGTKFAPTFFSWETADPVSGMETEPAASIFFGQAIQLTGFAAGNNTATGPKESPFAEPLAFDAKVPRQSDDEASGVTTPLLMESWVYSAVTPSITPRWNPDAIWVGKSVTFQVGIQPSITPDTFRVYIAANPREILGATPGGPGAEYAIFDDFIIDKRRLERTIVTIGGLHDPRKRSYLETSARLILDEVRVYGATAPGELPETSPGEPERGAGKIQGGRSYPARELEADEVTRPLAGASSALDVTRGSFTAGVSGGTPIPGDGPEISIDAVDRSLIAIDDEDLVVPRFETFWRRWPRTYFVKSLSGAGLTFSSAYFGPTRSAAAALNFRLIAYTSFSDKIDRPLTLGNGRGYNIEFVSVEAASITERLFATLAPVKVDFDVRVYTPLASARPRDVAPRWVRGMKAGGTNPILGLHSLDTHAFAGTKGALYECDDRWRPTGPSRELKKSIAFRGRQGESRIPLPAAHDRAEIVRSDLDIKTLLLPGGGAIRTVLWDAWVYLENHGTYQTLQWYGNQDEPHAQWWLRFDRGYPELVISSIDTSVGTGTVPDQGYYTARGDARLPLRVWTHLRWTVTVNTITAQSLQRPKLAVNGKRVLVTLSDKGTSAGAGANDWLHLPTIYPTLGETVDYHLVGCARAIHFAIGREPATTSPANISQQDTEPTRFQGYLDVLGGLVGYIANVQLFAGGPTEGAAVDFDPFTTKYGAQDIVKTSIFRDNFDRYGVGHKLYDSALGQYLTIVSHPFLSLWHEMGRSERLFSFANFAGETFVANGTRPVVIDVQAEELSAREAGVREPHVQPQVAVQRQPIFREAEFNFAGSVNNDPIIQRDRTSPTVPDLNYIYRNVGTLSLVQADIVGQTLEWKEDRYLCFKGYVRPARVDGRISLFSRRGSVSSGVFLEIRDGRCVLGWFDLSLKKEVTISTNLAVFKPGVWHYVYVRKWFPRRGQKSGALIGFGSFQSSNWQNAIFDQTYVNTNEAVAHDMMVVRQVATADTGLLFDNYTGFDLKAHRAYPGGGTWAAAGSSNRACISFTIDDTDWATLGVGHTVTLSGIVASYPTSATAGTNITTTGAGGQKFVLDHEGMLCQISQGPRVGQVFRIVEILSTTQIKVVDQTDASPAFTAGDSVGRLIISPGVVLLKSQDFDLSSSPDNSNYAVEVYGDQVTQDPFSGVNGCFADFISFAIVSALGENYLGLNNGNYGSPNIFEDAGAKLAANTIKSGNEIGTDAFGDNATNYAGTVILGLPYQGCPLQRVEVDATDLAHSAVDIRLYGANDGGVSTNQPNSSLGPTNSEPGLNVDAATSSASETFVFRHTREVIGGTRRALVTFYDSDNDVESFPNSTPDGTPNPVVITAGDEERNNPSGSINLIFTGWPKPVEDRKILLRIYLTPIDSGAFFRVAEADASRADSISVELDDILLSAGASLSLDAGAPPDCAVLGVVQNSMVYGNLPGDEDTIAHSLPALPESVPPSFLNSVSSGTGQGITGIAELGGFLIATKLNGIFAGTITESFVGFTQVTTSDGCVSHASIAQLEDRVYLVGGRGPIVLLPGERAPVPFFLGKRAQEYFRTDLDPDSLPLTAGVLYWRRNQYLFATRDRGRLVQDTRIGLEFDHPLAGPAQLSEMVAGHRYTRYQGPAVTRLATVVPLSGGSSVLIGGTVDGFVIWMDRDDTFSHLMGPTAAAWGDSTLNHEGLGEVAGLVDLVQEGPRGAVIRWREAGVEHEGYVLLAYDFAGDKFILVRAEAGGDEPSAAVDLTLTVGAQLHRIVTKDYDARLPHVDKEAAFLDVSRRVTAGTLKVDCFRDMESAPKGTENMDLSRPFQALEIGKHLKQARAFGFEIRTETPAVNTDFELYDLVLRYEESDNR